jgi:hypothetical protein
MAGNLPNHRRKEPYHNRTIAAIGVRLGYRGSRSLPVRLLRKLIAARRTKTARANRRACDRDGGCLRRNVEPIIDYAIFSITAREPHGGLFSGFSWRKVSARGDWFEFETLDEPGEEFAG